MFHLTQLWLTQIMLLCFIVPPPLVQAVAPIEQVVGQSLTLQCKITAVSDIASTVDIMWTSGGSEVRRVNVPGSFNTQLHRLFYYSSFKQK